MYLAASPISAMSNIKNAIPLILNQTDDHYASWVVFFNIHVCTYNVKDHIDETLPKLSDIDKDTWDRLDALVKQWKRLQEIFLDNQTTRFVYLEKQFNNNRPSAFSNMTDYCARLKNLADQLENVGNAVSETKMVLQLISGLTKGEYDIVATIIQQTDPLPSQIISPS